LKFYSEIDLRIYVMKIGSLIRISEPWIRVESGVGEWVVVQSAWIDSENLAPLHV